MTEPTPDETEDSLARNWAFTRDVAKDVADLKTWRAEVEAVSAWRRWVAPLVLSAIAMAITVVNFLLRHR